MTRLYFLASLAADLTSIEVMVFLGDGETFIGVADPRVVKDRLAQTHPVLKRYEEELVKAGLLLPNLSDEIDRRANLWRMQMDAAGGETSTPLFVTRREIERWLRLYLITQAIDVEPGDNPALQMQRLIEWPMRFVPVLEKGRFARVVDKQALAEQVARLFVREQVSRALSMTR